MRNPTSPNLERWRLKGPKGEPCGVFMVKFGIVSTLRCIASGGMGWDHVSVSLVSRCPKWKEMDHIKRLFWRDEEVVMQLHVTGPNKINLHPFVLHLWRPQTKEESEAYRQAWVKAGEETMAWTYPDPIPLPPRIFV